MSTESDPRDFRTKSDNLIHQHIINFSTFYLFLWFQPVSKPNIWLISYYSFLEKRFTIHINIKTKNIIQTEEQIYVHQMEKQNIVLHKWKMLWKVYESYLMSHNESCFKKIVKFEQVKRVELEENQKDFVVGMKLAGNAKCVMLMTHQWVIQHPI